MTVKSSKSYRGVIKGRTVIFEEVPELPEGTPVLVTLWRKSKAPLKRCWRSWKPRLIRARKMWKSCGRRSPRAAVLSGSVAHSNDPLPPGYDDLQLSDAGVSEGARPAGGAPSGRSPDDLHHRARRGALGAGAIATGTKKELEAKAKQSVCDPPLRAGP